MATDLQITGADHPLRLSNAEFHARPLTDKDYDEINAYIQSKVLETAKLAITAFSTSEDKREILAASISAATGLTWNSAEGKRVMSTVEGMCRLGWQMTKHRSKMTFEAFENHIRGKGPEILTVNLEEIDKVFALQNIEDNTEDNTENGEAGQEDASNSPKSDEGGNISSISSNL